MVIRKIWVLSALELWTFIKNLSSKLQNFKNYREERSSQALSNGTTLSNRVEKLILKKKYTKWHSVVSLL